MHRTASTRGRQVASSARHGGVATAVALLLLAGAGAANAAPATTERLSVSASGSNLASGSFTPAISADGRVAAFVSSAADVVADDANGRADVFVRRPDGATERISVDSAGGDADNASGGPSLNGDGRFVAFSSTASDLVPNDTNARSDVFVRDRVLGVTERVSVDAAGGNSDGGSVAPALSGDGRFVAFESAATDLVGGDGNRRTDIFLRDRMTGTTERVSVDASGGDPDLDSFNAAVSADGRVVAFESIATDLVAGDTGGKTDVFARDRVTVTTQRVSADTTGADADQASRAPSVSADGRLVAFSSSASDLVTGDGNGSGDVFLRDRTTQTTERISVDISGGDADAFSSSATIGGDGRFVAFSSSATDLATGDGNGSGDVFLRDRTTQTTDRISVDSAGGDPDGSSLDPVPSADGQTVVFTSNATDLVVGDTNRASDVFARRAEGEAPPSPVVPEVPQAILMPLAASVGLLILVTRRRQATAPD